MMVADTCAHGIRPHPSILEVSVVFRGRAVVVRSAAPEVLRGVAQRFGGLPASGADAQVGAIEVGRDADGYHLLMEDEASVRGGTLDDVVRCAEYHVVGSLIKATPELLWLHAGAVARDGRAVLFVGPSGCGKSTLATALCRRGYRYLADDTVPLDPASGQVIPFPLAPMVRQPAGQEVPPELLRTLIKTAPHLEMADTCREPSPIEAVAFPAYAPRAAAGLVRCSPATAALQLLQQCLNVTDQGGAAFQFLCAVAEGVPAFHLAYRDGETAASQVAQAHGLGWRHAAIAG